MRHYQLPSADGDQWCHFKRREIVAAEVGVVLLQMGPAEKQCIASYIQ